MTTTKSYDYLNRLTTISNAAGGSNVAVFNYANNLANQRTAITNVDSSRWVYQYDNLGQVISGKKYWSDGTPVAGQQFEYTFDDIGNRKSTAAGGDQLGANLRSANYTANSLNQYSSREVPGYVSVLGSAKTNATVSLWSSNSTSLYATTTRKGEYFHGELPLNNSTGAVWITITNLAVLQNGSNPDIVTNTVGQTFVPRTAENFYYDFDGNLTNDGRWFYTWDAENRLVRMVASTSTGPQQRMDFEFDSKGRRIGKKVWNNTAGSGSPALEQKYVYDGWNLVAILNPQSSILQAFTWGLDLSGSEQGAGGVGGLLLCRDAGSSTTNLVAFDGNGNVAAFVNATNGAVTAQYEYGPFGEVLRTTGASTKANPFRFSTKYQDDESDYLYYGYRSYNPSTGRWLNRDPLGELGFELLRGGNPDMLGDGPNHYPFVQNDPVARFDAQGLTVLTFSSQGESQRDPERFSIWFSWDSGRRSSSDAWTWQTVIGLGNRGGICNTGTRFPGHIGTFAQGWARLPCPLSGWMVTIKCTVVYVVVAVSTTPTTISAALGGVPIESSLLGEKLPRYNKLTQNGILVLTATETRTKTLILRPFVRYEIYNINPWIGGMRGIPGAFFMESLTVHCEEVEDY